MFVVPVQHNRELCILPAIVRKALQRYFNFMNRTTLGLLFSDGTARYAAFFVILAPETIRNEDEDIQISSFVSLFCGLCCGMRAALRVGGGEGGARRSDGPLRCPPRQRGPACGGALPQGCGQHHVARVGRERGGHVGRPARKFVIQFRGRRAAGKFDTGGQEGRYRAVQHGRTEKHDAQGDRHVWRCA